MNPTTAYVCDTTGSYKEFVERAISILSQHCDEEHPGLVVFYNDVCQTGCGTCTECRSVVQTLIYTGTPDTKERVRSIFSSGGNGRDLPEAVGLALECLKDYPTITKVFLFGDNAPHGYSSLDYHPEHLQLTQNAVQHLLDRGTRVVSVLPGRVAEQTPNLAFYYALSYLSGGYSILLPDGKDLSPECMDVEEVNRNLNEGKVLMLPVGTLLWGVIDDKGIRNILHQYLLEEGGIWKSDEFMGTLNVYEPQVTPSVPASVLYRQQILAMATELHVSPADFSAEELCHQYLQQKGVPSETTSVVDSGVVSLKERNDGKYRSRSGNRRSGRAVQRQPSLEETAKTILDELSTMQDRLGKYRRNFKRELEATCSICTEHFRFEPGAHRTTVTACSHMFHEHCLAEWATRTASCPICRTALA